MSKKLISLLIAMLLCLTMLAACSGGTPTTTPTGGSTTLTDTTTSGEPVETSFKLPITEEPVTLSFWTGALQATLATVAKGYDENAVFQELENRTGVHIDFETTSSANSSEAFNLMITSGEITDLVLAPTLYRGGLDAAVEDGYFLDMSPYAEEFLPNYLGILNSNENIKRDAMTDSGRIVALFHIFQTDEPLFMGIMIRKDWLDDLKLDIPESVDDWETVLTAFKTEKGAYAPMALNPYYDMFTNGFNALTSYVVVNGSVQFSPTSDNMRDCLTVYADWYKKGLVDPDFMSRPFSYAADTSMVVTGQTGAFNSFYTMTDMYLAASSDPNMELIAVKPPVPSEGFESKCAIPIPRITGAGIGISAKCSNKEIALKWLDYLYSEEGSMLCNYGMPGDTYNLVDGKPVFTDKVIKNPDGLAMAQAITLYTMPNGTVPNYYDWERELLGVSDAGKNMLDIWGAISSEYYFPSAAQLNIDENTEYATIYTDIQSYVSENIASFISGAKDINTEWAAFVSTVESMNISRCIELKQAAYDRYIARAG